MPTYGVLTYDADTRTAKVLRIVAENADMAARNAVRLGHKGPFPIQEYFVKTSKKSGKSATMARYLGEYDGRSAAESL